MWKCAIGLLVAQLPRRWLPIGAGSPRLDATTGRLHETGKEVSFPNIQTLQDLQKEETMQGRRLFPDASMPGVTYFQQRGRQE